MQRSCWLSSPDSQFARWLMIASMAIADDPLPLAPADGGHRVDGLDAGLHRLLDWLALDHRGRLRLQQAQFGALDRPLAVQRLAQRPDHAAQEGVADRDGQDLAGPLDLLALLDLVELAEDDHADLAHVQVERQAPDAVLEHEQLAGHGRGQALDPRDAVAALDDGAYLFPCRALRLILLDEARQRVPDLLRPDRQLSHCPARLVVRRVNSLRFFGVFGGGFGRWHLSSPACAGRRPGGWPRSRR